mmetsp:Transcript_18642/g.16506  ORF Transcript_18642/g.16506 Transcript_18642/m.16506 type:complete len:110 (+) Transcript_18642:1035-1364(+)
MKNPKMLRQATNHFNFETYNTKQLDKTLPLNYKYPSKVKTKVHSPQGRVVPLKLNKINKFNFVSLSPKARTRDTSNRTFTVGIRQKTQSHREDKKPIMAFKPMNLTSRN